MIGLQVTPTGKFKSWTTIPSLRTTKLFPLALNDEADNLQREKGRNCRTISCLNAGAASQSTGRTLLGEDGCGGRKESGDNDFVETTLWFVESGPPVSSHSTHLCLCIVSHFRMTIEMIVGSLCCTGYWVSYWSSPVSSDHDL